MNEIHRHEELRKAYDDKLPLQSVTNIIGNIRRYSNFID